MFLATGSSDKTVRVFELTTGDCHRVLTGHSDYITCLEFNVDNFDCLASACKSYLFFVEEGWLGYARFLGSSYNTTF